MSNNQQDTILEIGFEHCAIEQFQTLMQTVYTVDTHCIGELSRDQKTVTLRTNADAAKRIQVLLQPGEEKQPSKGNGGNHA